MTLAIKSCWQSKCLPLLFPPIRHFVPRNLRTKSSLTIQVCRKHHYVVTSCTACAAGHTPTSHSAVDFLTKLPQSSPLNFPKPHHQSLTITIRSIALGQVERSASYAPSSVPNQVTGLSSCSIENMLKLPNTHCLCFLPNVFGTVFLSSFHSLLYLLLHPPVIWQ